MVVGFVVTFYVSIVAFRTLCKPELRIQALVPSASLGDEVVGHGNRLVRTCAYGKHHVLVGVGTVSGSDSDGVGIIVNLYCLHLCVIINFLGAVGESQHERHQQV